MSMTAVRGKKITWSQIVDRQTGLLTPEQNEIVRKTRVLMLGIGGMGMNAAAHLVRCGFERFTLVDFDVVDGTSANRTPFAFDDTLGEQKVDAARRYMLKINPEAQIRAIPGVKLALNSDPSLIRELVEGHDVLSWAMDGIAGRIHYTRIAHEIGTRLPRGKPAVESWGVPNHFCVWTVPNSPGSPTWEDCFNLPTAGMDMDRIAPDDIATAQKAFFRQFAALPQLLEAVPPGLRSKWLNLRIANRTLGFFVVGCSALIAYEMLLNALSLGGLPLRGADAHYAPWMLFYDVRRNSAYERNFRSNRIRWTHPVTGVLIEEAS